jgi:hypothetical protein
MYGGIYNMSEITDNLANSLEIEQKNEELNFQNVISQIFLYRCFSYLNKKFILDWYAKKKWTDMLHIFNERFE